MRLITLTEQAVIELFKSVIMSEEIAEAISKIIVSFGGTCVQFIYTILYLHSNIYLHATSPDSPISSTDLIKILNVMKMIDPLIDVNQILVADKMDILYGNDYRSYSEYSKFTIHFYEEAFDIITGCKFNESDYLSESLFDETIKILEYVVSRIEQHVTFSGVEVDIEDLVILCVLPKGNVLYFVLM